MKEFTVYHLEEISSQEIMPGFIGKFVEGQQMNIAYWEIEEGAAVPMHQHVNEQCSHLIEGRFEFIINGETRIFEPGEIVMIGSNVPHGGRALTKCRMVDTWTPVRRY